MSENPRPAGQLPNLQALSADQAPVNVPLVGEALIEAQGLQDALGLGSVEEVVYVGLALLRDARGREILLREPGSATTERIPLTWRRR
jgi:hypothetical protein